MNNGVISSPSSFLSRENKKKRVEMIINKAINFFILPSLDPEEL